jgi:hypothetical protein
VEVETTLHCEEVQNQLPHEAQTLGAIMQPSYELAAFDQKTPAPSSGSDSGSTRLLASQTSRTGLPPSTRGTRGARSRIAHRISAARPDGFTKMRSEMKRITPNFWAKAELRNAALHGPANYTTELFVDLITAIGLQSINYLARKYAVFSGEGEVSVRQDNFWGLCKLCSYFFTPFWFASMNNMIYMNRFYCGDWAYNIHLFVTMMLFILLAVDVTQCQEQDSGKIDLDTCYSAFDANGTFGQDRSESRTFKWGVVALYILTGSQFWKPYFDAPESRTFCMIRIVSCYASAFLWMLSTLHQVNEDVCIIMTMVIFFLAEPASTGMSIIGARLYSNVNFHKRIAKFTIIVLSQTVIPAIVLQLNYHVNSAKFYTCFFSVIIAFCFKLIYFDFDHLDYTHLKGFSKKFRIDYRMRLPDYRMHSGLSMRGSSLMRSSTLRPTIHSLRRENASARYRASLTEEQLDILDILEEEEEAEEAEEVRASSALLLFQSAEEQDEEEEEGDFIQEESGEMTRVFSAFVFNFSYAVMNLSLLLFGGYVKIAVVRPISVAVDGQHLYNYVVYEEQHTEMLCGTLGMALTMTACITGSLQGDRKKDKRCGKLTRIVTRLFFAAVITFLLPSCIIHYGDPAKKTMAYWTIVSIAGLMFVQVVIAAYGYSELNLEEPTFCDRVLWCLPLAATKQKHEDEDEDV